LQGDEIEHVLVLVEFALDLDGGAVIVAVQPLALVALVADEVPGAENQVVFRDADLEALSHDRIRRPRGIATVRLSYPVAAERTGTPQARPPWRRGCVNVPRHAARRRSRPPPSGCAASPRRARPRLAAMPPPPRSIHVCWR